MKPVIETTIFNTKKDGRGQVIADLLSYEAWMDDWNNYDSGLITLIVDNLQRFEEENYPEHHEIKIFSGDISKVKKRKAPKTTYFSGLFIVIKFTQLS